MTENKPRLANIELLRSLAMVMVVILHFLTHSESLLEPYQPLSGVRILSMFFECFCLVAVNVYVFISGYYGTKSTFKPSRVLSLLSQIWFYALLVPLLLKAVGILSSMDMGIHGWIKLIFPIETEHYWFASAYFMLYLLTPILNRATASMTKKQFQIVLAGLLILFCGIKSISPVTLVIDKYGYDLPWFICVYLVAAYLRLYGNKFLEKRGWPVYIGSAAAGFGICLVMRLLTGISESFIYYSTVPTHYNFILCLIGAIGLFYGFTQITIKEGSLARFIRKIGPLSFGVYLLHEHIDIRTLWYGWLKNIINPTGKSSIAYFLLELFFCVIVVFTAGIIIDFIRSLLFKAVAKVLKSTPIAKGIQKLDTAFMEDN